jgi:hypothetical protein
MASTVLHENGVAHDHQLGHLVGNQSSAPYNHGLYLAPRAEIMQCWAINYYPFVPVWPHLNIYFQIDQYQRD